MTAADAIETQEQAEREEIEAAEAFVLDVVDRERPDSLQSLTASLAKAETTISRQLLRVAIWRLLSNGRLVLTADRRLEPAGR